MKHVLLIGFMALSAMTSAYAAENIGDIQQRLTLPPCPNCYDVLGVALRSSCKTASIADYTREEFKGKYDVLDRIAGDLPPLVSYNEFVTSVQFHRKSSGINDIIDVFCSSPLTGTVVTGIRRSVYFDNVEQAPLLNAVIDDAHSKNGVPIWEGNTPVGQARGLMFAMDNMLERKTEQMKDGPPDYPDDRFVPDLNVAVTATYSLSGCSTDQERVCEMQVYLADILGRHEDNSQGKMFLDELKAMEKTLQEQRQQDLKNAPAAPKL
jgi:hypothetical protein